MFLGERFVPKEIKKQIALLALGLVVSSVYNEKNFKGARYCQHLVVKKVCKFTEMTN